MLNLYSIQIKGIKILNEIIKNKEYLKNEIMRQLPNDEKIKQEVSYAISLVEKHLYSVSRDYDKEDNIGIHSLRLAVEVIKYIKRVYTEDHFKYELIVIALLHDIIEDVPPNILIDDLSPFKYSIFKGIVQLTNIPEKENAIGRSIYMRDKFKHLLDADVELFLIKVLDRIDNLSCYPFIRTTEEYLKNPKLGEMRITGYLLETSLMYNNLLLTKSNIPSIIDLEMNKLISLIDGSTLKY